MSWYADLHVHSRYSRATGRDATLEPFSFWARRKGLSVVATGDFTHPAWMQEIRDKLVPAEEGLFRLCPELEREAESRVPDACRGATAATRFILQVEISTIYKRDGRTRKVHHLLFAPDVAGAERLARALARIGNLNADGRPILGLDSRNLLEITLQAGEGCFLIPAHIWTPWFSVLGSKSGFDRVEDCYADLASHIFALETGLSSDPPMNWRLAGLDRYRLVSNSDAHSPSKLGREACVFDTELRYAALRDALATGRGYGGTLEFFPEEGKYHLDGHRKCNVCQTPDESRRTQGLCPVCGKALTIGVMNRVDTLADRPEGTPPPHGAAPFRSLIPLGEILGEIVGSAADSKRATAAAEALLQRLGPELYILADAPIGDIARLGSPRLAEAIERMRAGRVIREAGYDGEYGVIRLFSPGELRKEDRTGLLFAVEARAPAPKRPAKPRQPPAPTDSPDKSKAPPPLPGLREPSPEWGLGVLATLDPEQRDAAQPVPGPLLIVAGPGTGKTRTLTHRIAALVEAGMAQPGQCLTITFTHRAANELRQRLNGLLGERAADVPVMTFHAFAYRLVRRNAARLGLPPEPALADDDTPGGVLHFDDLCPLAVRLLEEHADLRADCRLQYPWVSVDEYQDVDASQYALVRLLSPPDGNLCAIGDPDQAIYGFRGADVGFFGRFTQDFASARVARLWRNYRSSRPIVDAAVQMIAPSSLVPGRRLEALRADGPRVVVHEAGSDAAEAEFVTHTVEQLIGGSAFFSMDSDRVTSHAEAGFGLSDFAVLYRTDAQADAVAEALSRSGMPFQRVTHHPLIERPGVRRAVEAMQLVAPPATPSRRLSLALEVLRHQIDPRQVQRMETDLAPAAARHADMDGFLAEIALASDADAWDPRAERISLLTLHASKGLEFAVVFIVGCEDGVLPLRRAGEAVNEAEERRLLFVGVTRARELLHLCRSRRRRWRGATRDMAPSPFLSDVRPDLVEQRRSAPYRRQRPSATQLDLF